MLSLEEQRAIECKAEAEVAYEEHSKEVELYRKYALKKARRDMIASGRALPNAMPQAIAGMLATLIVAAVGMAMQVHNWACLQVPGSVIWHWLTGIGIGISCVAWWRIVVLKEAVNGRIPGFLLAGVVVFSSIVYISLPLGYIHCVLDNDPEIKRLCAEYRFWSELMFWLSFIGGLIGLWASYFHEDPLPKCLDIKTGPNGKPCFWVWDYTANSGYRFASLSEAKEAWRMLAEKYNSNSKYNEPTEGVVGAEVDYDTIDEIKDGVNSCS